MSTINEKRQRRAKVWEDAKKFLDSRRDERGMLSAEDTATYERMEKEIVDLGKEIERDERLEAIGRELSAPTSSPITERPAGAMDEKKKGRASDEYRKAFWNEMRTRHAMADPVIRDTHSRSARTAREDTLSLTSTRGPLSRRSLMRTSSGDWRPSSGHPQETGRFRLRRRREQRHGSMRKARIPRAMTHSARSPSGLTSSER